MGVGLGGGAFARDILRIEDSGPSRPQLTIVDLPGLIHSRTKHQSQDDVNLVKALVKEYMEERRSIILAVVSAKYDHANQWVLTLAREADEDGDRSLGVITKPDLLKSGSGSEATVMSLASNEDVNFKLGWHVLKNMDTDDKSTTLEVRDAEEAKFLSQEPWSRLPKERRGIDGLRKCLSKVLLAQIRRELPNLMNEIHSQISTCRDQLEQLGEPRTTVNQQKSFLVHLSMSYQNLVKAAVGGTYDNPFFDDTESEDENQHKRTKKRAKLGKQTSNNSSKPGGDDSCPRRLRAVLQQLNMDFSKNMESRGHKFEIPSSLSPEEGSSSTQISSGAPIKVTREAYIDQVSEIMRKTMGRELPGTFNPLVVKDLFAEHSRPWNHLAKEHIVSIWTTVRRFLLLVVAEIADPTTEMTLIEELFDPGLEEMKMQLHNKVDELLQYRRDGHPITYNQSFTEKLQQSRNERRRETTKAFLKKFFNCPLKHYGVQVNRFLDIEELSERLAKGQESDMHRFAASEALDAMFAYYDVGNFQASVRFVYLRSPPGCSQTLRR